MVKKGGFGAGHSLTLCKAAEITRMRRTIARRMSTVGTSIDASKPRSLHRKFDDSKGKLQRKRLKVLRDRDDKVLQHRIKMLNARDPMIGEGPKYEGGSFHSPPPRADEARRRANKYRKIAHRQNIERLDKLNAKMAQRLPVQPPDFPPWQNRMGQTLEQSRAGRQQVAEKKDYAQNDPLQNGRRGQRRGLL